jgi:Big-like domain-containing protein
VLSDSYGLCELGLGTTGNAFYLSLWEQAAAQGITVAVAAGDTGPAGCDPDTQLDPYAATQGLAVSGLASTPYNVAVGGTDFNTPTAADLAKYWSTTNTSTTPPVAASALGYVPEIPWDDSTCAQDYLANPASSVVSCTVDTTFGDDLAAASGGPSNCAISDSSGNCNAGYPKPAFQQGGITPADNVRDIPDISLFAGNGINFSFYIVCESDVNPNSAPCDLTTSSTSSTENFSGLGGTSGGTPTFAAIMALVNQKTGERQGNANYVLYNLAQTKETYSTCNSNSTPAAGCIFYDIAEGTNTVACDFSTPNCSNQTGSGVGVIIDTLSAYNGNGNPAFKAVQGYDLATGLGSINVANLLNSWSSANRASTTTTLGAPSPASGTSGSTTFSVKVTVTSGSGTPSGDVSLNALASDSSVLASFGPFTLSGGSVTASTKLLPPGTASISATYGGDATHATSTSAATALAVSGANQTSKTVLSWVTSDSNGNPVLSTSSQNATYGSSYVLQIAVTNSSGTSCGFGYPATKPATPCPTGTVALMNGTTPLKDWPIAGQLNATNIAKLNNQGIAEDQPIQLSPGSYSLQADFTSGDTNFQNSNSNTVSVTITQAATTTVAGASSTSIMPGASVTLTAYVVTNSNGAGPTGSMTFANGSTSLGSATCQPTGGAADTNPPIQGITAGTAYCVATLMTTSISGLYPPPIGAPRTPGIRLIPLIVAALSLLLFALGWRWMPTPRRRAYAYFAAVAFALLAVGIAGCGGGSSSNNSGGSNRTITATYPGDTNYGGSNGSVSITVQ